MIRLICGSSWLLLGTGDIIQHVSCEFGVSVEQRLNFSELGLRSRRFSVLDFHPLQHSSLILIGGLPAGYFGAARLLWAVIPSQPTTPIEAVTIANGLFWQFAPHLAQLS